MVYLLGTCPVTVWEDCQVASSSLMNPMHNAVQEELVGSLNHQHAICPLHRFMPHSGPKLLQGHLDWCVLSEVREQSAALPLLSFINYITE